MKPEDFYGNPAPLTQDNIRTAAEALGVPPAVIAAVIEVEAAGAGYLTDGRPKILFEAHLFGRMTNHKFSHIKDSLGNPISSRSWQRELYGKAGAHQYERLGLAMKCDESSALRACSWGAFQILGSNHGVCGFTNVHDFVKAHVRSSGEQLDCFIRFVKGRGLADELQRQDWADFAEAYNGPAYKKNAYDTKLQSAYARLVSRWTEKYVQQQTQTIQVHATENSGATGTLTLTRDLVAKVQSALNAYCVVLPPLVPDGWMGPKTEAAIRKFQQIVGMEEDGQISKKLVGKLLG